MKVAIVVDNPLRDLPSLVLIAMRLCQAGVECFLVPMNILFKSAGQEIWQLQPDLILFNYLRTNNQKLAQDFAAAGIRVGVLDNEGGVLVDLPTYTQWLADDAQIRQQIAFYCTWGNQVADYLVEQNIYSPKQVQVTGSPRMDFYVYPWRTASVAASPYVDQYTQPLVLINGNFSLANPQFLTPEAELKCLIDYYGYEAEFAKKWQAIDQKALESMAALTNSLARQFTHVSFVYRPHPFEKVSTYQELLEPLPNVHLSKQGTVDGWILRASAVIQRSCSTAIEAGLANVPALSPRWIATGAEQPSAEAVSVACQTEAELFAYLQSILDGKFKRPPQVEQNLKGVIHDWFYRIDGQAYERVATCVLEHLQEKNEQYSPPANNNSIKLRLRNIIIHTLGLSPSWSFSQRKNLGTANPLMPKQRVREILINLLGLPSNWSFRQGKTVEQDYAWWDNSEKFFGVEQVQPIIDAIAAASDNFPHLVAAQAVGEIHKGYVSRSISMSKRLFLSNR